MCRLCITISSQYNPDGLTKTIEAIKTAKRASNSLFANGTSRRPRSDLSFTTFNHTHQTGNEYVTTLLGKPLSPDETLSGKDSYNSESIYETTYRSKISLLSGSRSEDIFSYFNYIEEDRGGNMMYTKHMIHFFNEGMYGKYNSSGLYGITSLFEECGIYDHSIDNFNFYVSVSDEVISVDKPDEATSVDKLKQTALIYPVEVERDVVYFMFKLELDCDCGNHKVLTTNSLNILPTLTLNVAINGISWRPENHSILAKNNPELGDTIRVLMMIYECRLDSTLGKLPYEMLFFIFEKLFISD